MDEIDVDGLRIGYQRAGQGPPVVLLHGFVGDSREWRGQIERFSDEFTVVAWDAPGAGRSADPPEWFRMPEYADYLAGFIDALGLDRPHVVGLSFGGTLALELYRRHPSMPRSLVLAGAYAGWIGSLGAETAEERVRSCERLSEASAEEFVSTLLPGMLSTSAPKYRVEELALIMSEFHPAGFRAMARSLAESDLRDVLPRIDVPMLLLYGDEDARASLAVADDLHTAIPGSRLVVMPGVGHMSNVEAPETFNTEVRNFLRSADR